MADHIITGQTGEQLAVEHLQRLGYTILETNWRFRRSEVDIIAMDGPILVFVEVKTRSSDYFGPPESFVSSRKKTMLQDAASAYTHQIQHTWEIRFDIIGVLLQSGQEPQLRHFSDAFFPGFG